ncbi:uncharacterized protein [Temnothorax nylanderi]|uniref:uncharacterized protein n=1 Tax=Temnothorax nylanderi TaxID=102681 RepID=UPI003A8C8258
MESMDKYLRPERFDVEPTSISADQQWLHWKRTFSKFLNHISDASEESFQLLTNYVALNVYQYISESGTFKDAIDTLESLYIKPRNEIYARHCLSTRRQRVGELVDQLLENTTLTMDAAFDQARALEMAEQHSASYSGPLSTTVAASNVVEPDSVTPDTTVVAVSKTEKCYFCGETRHPRTSCSARNATPEALSFINHSFVKRCNIKVLPFGKITLANSFLSFEITGQCKSHSSVNIAFLGRRLTLNICSVAVAKVPPVSLFANLTPDCTPIATKSRRHSKEYSQFIASEIKRLLEEKIIEPSNSPWRAQAFVVRDDNHKARMVIDYSQTINKFTMLDAWPLLNIKDIITKTSVNEVFSTIDLKSAYHQIPILQSETQYTAFEANGKLYHPCVFLLGPQME